MEMIIVALIIGIVAGFIGGWYVFRHRKENF